MDNPGQPPRQIGFEQLIEGCVRIEHDLNLPSGCLVDLPTEKSDWAFVIKIATLVEAAITHILADEINDERFRQLVTRLRMQGETGKLPTASGLGLIEAPERDFAAGITGLRNRLAHDPQFVAFNFGEYISSLTDQQRADFFRWATRGRTHVQTNDKAMIAVRMQIWAQACILLTRAMASKGLAEAKRRRDAMYTELAESVLNAPPFEDSDLSEDAGA